ncbi:MAG: YjfB family protein [Roseburia sp.]|nr:YjfB family protein [Roseburia sp.]MCM1279493.1 YjfB family protein [Robinsoniella sp.]
MDIPALSMAMATSQLQTDIGIAVLSNTIDLTQTLGDNLTDIIDAAAMERSVYPSIGGNIDLSI